MCSWLGCLLLPSLEPSQEGPPGFGPTPISWMLCVLLWNEGARLGVPEIPLRPEAKFPNHSNNGSPGDDRAALSEPQLPIDLSTTIEENCISNLNDCFVKISQEKKCFPRKRIS